MPREQVECSSSAFLQLEGASVCQKKSPGLVIGYGKRSKADMGGTVSEGAEGETVV